MRGVAVLVLAFGSVLAQPVFAGVAEPDTTPPPANPKGATNGNTKNSSPDTDTGADFGVESDANDGAIGAEVNQPSRPGITGPTSFSGTSNTPPCTHRPATYGDYPNVVPPDGGIPNPNDQIRRDLPDGRSDTGWIRDCPGGGTEPFYWAPAAVDPVDLIPNALAQARSRLAAPIPAINPDATAGGIVNLGMWLAVDDPGTTTARATLAGVWAQVTAQPTNITVDLGNGDTVTCDDLGTPIPDTELDSLDEGPCGYTYRQSSPDDEPYQLTITTSNTITWTTSSGASGSLAPIARSTTIDYDVDEIQTIGVSN